MAHLDNFRLVVFRAVADQLSFRKAAEELYLTQPAVSSQIKALEDDLGVHLFNRAGPRVQLTRAGEILLRHANRSTEVLQEAESEIAALSGMSGGELALGASTTIAQYILPGILSLFCQGNPKICPSMVSGNTEDIVRAIEEGSISIGCIEGPPRSRSIRSEPFLQDELVLIVPSGHEWAERGRIAADEMVGVPLLLREQGSGTRRVVELALSRKGIKLRALNVVMQLDSTEAIKSAVEAGLGVGFVSRWALGKDTRAGQSIQDVEIEGLQIARAFLVAYKKGPSLSGRAQEFHRFLMTQTKRRART